MLRTKELLDVAEVGKFRPRWEGPFTVAALADPNMHAVTLRRRFKFCPTVNVDRLKRYHSRVARHNPSDPGLNPGPAGSPVVDQLSAIPSAAGPTASRGPWVATRLQ